MPLSVFVGFNLVCIGLWIAAIPGLRSASPWALGAAWFLAIAGVMNGIAHPLLAVAAGGYFPGLVSSPLIGVAGLVLWRRLRAATVG
ncbi:MAG: HXXEE domain-containing protein [Pseudomonadales bacterium]